MSTTLGERLRILRKARGLSQEAVARRAEIGLRAYGDLERGRASDPHYSTLEGIAYALNTTVAELVSEEPELVGTGKGEASQEAGPADVHRLFAVHQTKAEWREAVDNSQRFRSQAKERLREQLSLWEAARNEGASDEKRRRLLDEVGLILDEALEVLRKLLENLGEGLDSMAVPRPYPYWTECQRADTLYRELLGTVGGAGLSVHPKKTDQAPGQSDQALGQWRHEVLGAA
jgi:transcriptional regulator with XRE-family HTH domain